MKNKKEKKLLLEQLKKAPIVELGCQKVGIARSSYYRWLKNDKNFAKEAEQALLEGCLLINDLAESQIISAIRDRNMTATTLWLKTHHKTYTDKLEISNRIVNVDEQLTSKQKTIVRAALRLASLDKRYEKQ